MYQCLNQMNKVLMFVLALILATPLLVLAQVVEDNGVRREYYDSGKLLSETDCLQENSTGVYREYYEDGKTKMEVHYDAGQLQGPYADYCEDGSLHVKFAYKNNKRDGQYNLYYDNGEIQAKGMYVNGEEQGLHQVFYPNGQLSAEANYVDGKEEGIAKTYYKDGSLWEEFSYSQGVRNGEYLEYTSENILIRQVMYKDGKFVFARNYDEARNIILEVMEEKISSTSKSTIDKYLSELHKCVSNEIGIAFSCNPNWKLNRFEKTLKISISQVPKVEMMVEETDQSLRFMHELTAEALTSMNRYEEGFHVERFEHCDRETVKVNGYLKGKPNVRVSDIYLLDHLHVHTVQFTVGPKEAWEPYKLLIKEIMDSLVFIKHDENVKFVTKQSDGKCEELIVE